MKLLAAQNGSSLNEFQPSCYPLAHNLKPRILTMKWKIILRFEMSGARNRKGARYALGTKEIVPRLKELNLKQTRAGTWCGDAVSSEVAKQKLPEIFRIFAEPRSVENTTGELGHLFLYIERA